MFELHYVAQLVKCYMSRAWTIDSDTIGFCYAVVMQLMILLELKWNGWSSEEQVIQLAGHLKGRALQEWNLLGKGQVQNYEEAVLALRERLDPRSRVLASQDFGTLPSRMVNQCLILCNIWSGHFMWPMGVTR